MFDREVIKGGKKAAISTEVVIGIALTVAVLFIVLAMFNGNIGTMIANSGIKNMFTNNSAKTDYDKRGIVDITQVQVNTPITGEQALKNYLTQAQAAIEKYKSNPPKTEAEMEDLAKQATIAKIGGVLSAEDEGSFFTKYGISIDTTSPRSYNTTIQTSNKSKSIEYPFTNSIKGGDPLGNTQDQLTLIEQVDKLSFH